MFAAPGTFFDCSLRSRRRESEDYHAVALAKADTHIFNFILPIADFQILKMRACAPVVPNRKSTVANLKSGGSAADPGL
jgi:hypothetical protein